MTSPAWIYEIGFENEVPLEGTEWSQSCTGDAELCMLEKTLKAKASNNFRSRNHSWVYKKKIRAWKGYCMTFPMFL